MTQASAVQPTSASRTITKTGGEVPAIDGLVEAPAQSLSHQQNRGDVAKAVNAVPSSAIGSGARELTIGGKKHIVVTANANAKKDEHDALGTQQVLERDRGTNTRVVCGPPTNQPEAQLPSRFGLLREYVMAAVFGLRIPGPGDSKLTTFLRIIGLLPANLTGRITRQEAQAFEDEIPKHQVTFKTCGDGEHPGHFTVGLGTLRDDLYASSGKLVARAGEHADVHSQATETGNRNVLQTVTYAVRRLFHQLAGTKPPHTGVEPEKYVSYTQSRGFSRRSQNAFKIKVLDETLNRAGARLAKVGRAINRAAQETVIAKIGAHYDFDLSLDPEDQYCSELAVTVFRALRTEAEKHAEVFHACGRADLLKRFQNLRLDTEAVCHLGPLLKQFVATPDTVCRHPELEWIAGNEAGLRAYIEALQNFVSAVEPTPFERVA